jgi:hypothetical protein
MIPFLAIAALLWVAERYAACSNIGTYYCEARGTHALIGVLIVLALSAAAWAYTRQLPE